MYYSPVRHSSPKRCVRLACIRHAASVHPEPGSNSQIFIYFFVFYFSWPLFSGLNFFLNFIDVVFSFFLSA